MKLTGTKKPCPTTNLNKVICANTGILTMSNLTQNFVNPNNQPLVIGEFTIRQDDEGRYCLNDLHKASGELRKDRPRYFLENDKTLELIQVIKDENYDVGNPSSCFEPVNIIRGRGKEQGTYVVKELVYSYAMWISAKFHLIVVRAYDSLVMQWKINDRQSISPEQQALLHEIVSRRSGGERKIFAEMWARHNRHFKIPRYAELLAIHFPEAVHYLETMDIKAQTKKQAPLFDQNTYERVRSLVEAIILENDEIIPVLLAVKMIDEPKFLYYANKVVRANERARDLSWALDFRNKLDEPLIDQNCRVISLSTGQRFAARSNWFNAPG